MTRSPSEALLSLALFGGLRAGTLTVTDHAGHERTYVGRLPGPKASVHITRASAARRIITGGALGMAEAYMAGEWETPDLQAVLDLGVANMSPAPKTRTNLLTPAARAWHSMRDNDPEGSKRNIEYHYDLGNEFYRLWLDETMAYSAACFDCEGRELADAQVRKWDRLLDLLQPGSRDHLLEIGCGWGGFAIHAARSAGCRVTGITISDEQHAWATRAVREAGLEDRIDIRLQDYRVVPETFSHIASIEMFEAVGEKWWPVFFSRVKELLSPGGAAALQVITIEDHRFEDYRSHPDFIQRYIFPGGMLPSPERFGLVATEASLTLYEPTFFGKWYADTLAEWARRFEAALPQVRELGFDERFVRMWRYYLAYCAAGFKAGTIDVMQVRMTA